MDEVADEPKAKNVWETQVIRGKTGEKHVAKFFTCKSQNIDKSLISTFNAENSNLLCPIIRTEHYNTTESSHKIIYTRLFIEGKSLSDLLNGNGDNTYNEIISFESKWIISYGLCKSLYLLHQNGILHTNLKPSNILIRNNMFPVLCDPIPTELFFESFESELFLRNNILYYPYEFAKAHIYDKFSDIYSLGLLLYTIFTGELPFAHCAGENPLEHIINRDSPVNYKIIPPLIRRLIKICCSINPKLRPNIREVLCQMEQVMRVYPCPNLSRFLIGLSEYKFDAETKIENIFYEFDNESNKFYQFHYLDFYYINHPDDQIAKTLLAYLFCEGLYVKDMAEKGVEILTEGIRNNDPLSMLFAAISCFECHTSFSPEESFKYLQQVEAILEEKDDNVFLPVLYFYIGTFYEEGFGTSVNKKKAIQYYLTSANYEYSMSQYALGLCYMNGVGEDKDVEKAFSYFSLAAEHNHQEAANYLSFCYKNGVGPRIDLLKAFEYLKMPAEQNNANAQCQLGLMYINGTKGKKKMEKGRKYLEMAAFQNHVQANYMLGMIYEQEKLYKKMIYHYGQAARSNHADAQYRLGLCFINGKGIEMDKEKALDLIKFSAGQGNPNALKYLDQLSQNGSDADNPK